MATIITFKEAHFRDPAKSGQIDIRFEEPAECEGIHCLPPEREIDPDELADLTELLAEEWGISHEEARRCVIDQMSSGTENNPRVITSYHGHVIISGRDPEAAPRYFAVLPY